MGRAPPTTVGVVATLAATPRRTTTTGVSPKGGTAVAEHRFVTRPWDEDEDDLRRWRCVGCRLLAFVPSEETGECPAGSLGLDET